MRVLVVGLGSAGTRHVANLRQLRPDTHVIAWRHTPAHILSNLDEVDRVATLEEGIARRPDFAIIANPPALHMEVAIRLAQAGVPMLIEKPLAAQWDQVDEFVLESERQDLPVLVGYTLRFHPALQAVAALLQEQRVGRPLALRADVGQYLPEWRPGTDYRRCYSARQDLGGGVILDLIHEIDLAIWLMGAVGEVVCLSGQLGNLEIETEDSAEIVLRFRAGTLGSVHMDYLRRPASRTGTVICSEGVVLWDCLAPSVKWSGTDGAWFELPISPFTRNDLFVAEMEHYLSCLAGTARPVVTARDAAESLRVALAAKESANTGARVALNASGDPNRSDV